MSAVDQARSRVGRYLQYRQRVMTSHANAVVSDDIHGVITTVDGKPVRSTVRASDLQVLVDSAGFHPFGSKALGCILEALGDLHDMTEWMEDDGVFTAYTTDEIAQVQQTVIAYMKEITP